MQVQALEREVHALNAEVIRLRLMAERAISFQHEQRKGEKLDSGAVDREAPPSSIPGLPRIPLPEDPISILPSIFAGTEGTKRLFRVLMDTYPWLVPEEVKEAKEIVQREKEELVWLRGRVAALEGESGAKTNRSPIDPMVFLMRNEKPPRAEPAPGGGQQNMKPADDGIRYSSAPAAVDDRQIIVQQPQQQTDSPLSVPAAASINPNGVQTPTLTTMTVKEAPNLGTYKPTEDRTEERNDEEVIPQPSVGPPSSNTAAPSSNTAAPSSNTAARTNAKVSQIPSSSGTVDAGIFVGLRPRGKKAPTKAGSSRFKDHSDSGDEKPQSAKGGPSKILRATLAHEETFDF